MADKRKKKRKRRRLRKWVVVATWILVLVLLTLSVVSILKTKKKRVFTVGNEKIYIDEVSFYALQYAYDYHISNVDMLYEYFDGVTTYEEQYKAELKQLIVDTKVMYLCAQQKGIKLSEKDQGEIAASVKDTLTNIGKELERLHISEELVTRVLTEQKYADLLKATVEQSKENEKTYFHTYNLLFPTVKTKADGTVATNADGSLVPINKADKEKQYELAMKAIELSRQGKAVADIAESLEVTATSGDLYGDMECYDSQRYLDEINGMAENEYSGVVETIYGYNVFFLISKDDQEYASRMSGQEQMFLNSEAYEEQMEKWRQDAQLDERRLESGAWEAFSMKDYVIKR